MSVKESPADHPGGYSSKMKCRSLPINALEKAFAEPKLLKTLSQKLFSSFILKWPDFIEFDELNGKIVTKHTEEQCFRVWSLTNYELLYVLNHDQLVEFKIW